MDFAKPLGHRVDEGSICVEEAVDIADVAGAERGTEHGGIAVVAVAATEPHVVCDVARRLLEIGHDAAPLEHLGEKVRCLLAREVHSAELRDRVVAVLEEDPVVELLSTPQPDGRVDGRVAADVEVTDEFVEEEAPQALVRARVAGEQRALHDLGEVDQREDGTIEVRHVSPKDVLFLGRELLGDVDGHRVRLRPRRSRAGEPTPLLTCDDSGTRRCERDGSVGQHDLAELAAALEPSERVEVVGQREDLVDDDR